MIGAMVVEFEIGEVKIHFLRIARVQRDFDQISEIFTTVEKRELRAAVRSVQPEGGGRYLEWNFNCALIRTPADTILVDTGFGFSSGGPGVGTAQLLSECGVRPTEVNTVVITHGHGDHIGGLTENGAPAMPKARVVITAPELEFWIEGQAKRAFGAEGPSAQQRAFSICRNQIECIDMDSRIAESDGATIHTLPAPGHTPGHIGISVDSQDEHLWLLVDTIHAPFQLQHPDWSPRFDVNPELACTTRRDLLAQAARLEVPVHLYHFPFPGAGLIEEADQAYTFVAVSE